MSEPHFAVATFMRVFDTNPLRDVISLEQLTRGLCTFILKDKAQSAPERNHRLLQSTWKAFREGTVRGGRYAGAFERAAREAEEAGEDPAAAAEREFEKLLEDVKGEAKRDLRLWSPALYPEDSTRGSENVIHLSCLVLDYDAGIPVADALAVWQDYFCILHSTWSYTPAKPKFRLILPLAEPVTTADWSHFYLWAQERTGMTVDPTGRSIGSTFALPAIFSADQPRLAFSRPGPLLDARLEGLIAHPADPPPPIEATEPNHFRIPLAGHETAFGSWPDEIAAETDEWANAFDW